MNNVSTINLPVSTFGNIDDILVNASGSAGRIKKVDFLGAMNDWSTITNKPFDDINNAYFRTTERADGADILTFSDSIIAYFQAIDDLQTEVTALDTKVDNNLSNTTNLINETSANLSGQITNINAKITTLEGTSHTHDNKAVIDLFSTSNGKLLWNGTTVGSDYELPVATSSVLGGVKPDGTTITIDSDGTIHGASQGLDFNALSTSMTTGTQNGITVTADTENRRFNFEVTGIPTIAIDNEGYWTINGDRGINPTKAQGEKGADGTNGINGKDGASPTIDPTTKNWIVGTVDTGVKAEAQSNYFYTGIEFPTSDLIDGDLYLSFADETKGNVYQYQGTTLDWALQGNLYGGGAVINDTSTNGNTVTWSANKINSVIGDINTVLASVTGGIS